MTQVSGQWDGQLTGDAAIAPYGQNDVGVHKGAGVLYDRAVQGVLFRNDEIRIKRVNDTYETCDLSNVLEVTNPAGLTVRVATGGAIVDGLEAYNTADVDFSTTDDTTAIQAPGSGSNFYRVVLRKDWSAQTIRLAVLDVHVVAPVAVTQVDGTTWEISLATVEITSGSVVTVTDTRRFVPEIHTEMVVNRTRTFFVPYDSGESTGSVPLVPNAAGVPLTTGVNSSVYGSFFYPSDYVSDLSVKAVITASGNGDVRVGQELVWVAEGDELSFSYGSTTKTLANAPDLIYILEAVNVGSPGDIGKLSFDRVGEHAEDTLASPMHFFGWIVSYTADS